MSVVDFVSGLFGEGFVDMREQFYLFIYFPSEMLDE